tara:strand:- start:280 stop:429 length:150 start_codon:yes stop_codon:yes gene_type:complete
MAAEKLNGSKATTFLLTEMALSCSDYHFSWAEMWPKKVSNALPQLVAVL